jgi:hypothetical protein
MDFARHIAFAGVSAEELAELRGLVERAGELLESPWRLADVADADLVVVDAAATEGLLAQARAAERGVPCVVLDAEDDPELLLARPFEIDGLMQLLVNAAPRLPRRVSAVVGGADQFGYGRADIVPPAAPGDGVSLEAFFAADLVGLIPDARTASELAREPQPATTPDDAMLLAAVAALPIGAMAGASVPFARSAGPAVAEPPVDPAPAVAAAAEAVVQAPPAPEPVRAEAAVRPPAAAPAEQPQAAATPRAQYPLLDYLDGKLIGLPSRIALDGCPPLVIDPTSKSFHFGGTLRQIEPYLDALLPRTQWSALLQSQLSLVRREQPGRPFDLLRWYQALRKAPPGLPPALDPSSLYSLRQSLDLVTDHPRAARIAEALKVPRGLGEIANVSATSVVEVYAAVGAFAAIGYLEQHPRHRPAAPAPGARGPRPGTR